MENRSASFELLVNDATSSCLPLPERLFVSPIHIAAPDESMGPGHARNRLYIHTPGHRLFVPFMLRLCNIIGSCVSTCSVSPMEKNLNVEFK